MKRRVLPQTFAMDKSQVEMVFPAALTAKDRASLHAACEAYGLRHQSRGDEPERQFVVWKKARPDLMLPRCCLCSRTLPATLLTPARVQRCSAHHAWLSPLAPNWPPTAQRLRPEALNWNKRRRCRTRPS